MAHRWLSTAIAVLPFILAAALQTRADHLHERPEVGDVTGRDMLSSADASSVRMSPKRIAAAIETELEHDAMPTVRSVDVEVKDGMAILTGSVDSLLAKERAERIARTVMGISLVTNGITVRPRRDMTPDELRSMTRQALLGDSATEPSKLDISAQPNGEVRLGGTVESWAERQLAERTAKSVSGVTAVRNDIAVTYARERRDSEIAADVRGLLHWDAYLDDRRIDVAVQDGVVMLSGTVGTAAEMERAVNIAWLAGTQDVDAKALKVVADLADVMKKRAPAETMSSAAIATAVRNRLALSPYVEIGNVSVDVDEGVQNGVATLAGAVDSAAESRAAQENAFEGVQRASSTACAWKAEEVDHAADSHGLARSVDRSHRR